MNGSSTTGCPQNTPSRPRSRTWSRSTDLLEGRSARSIAIGGASAGGGLSLAAVHRFIALDLDVPGAIHAGTAWADLTRTSDSLFTNEGLDGPYPW